MIRLLHYSDVHLTIPRLGWRVRDTFSKKTLGWVNVHLLGRGRRFRHATAVADAMIADARTRGHDAIVFTGDATKLGFDGEFAFAAGRLGVGDPTLPPTVAVPGNHDYYTHREVKSGVFEKHFAPWLVADERVGEHTYPYARRVGHVWVVAVCSSHPSYFNTSASGAVGAEQLERLKTLCAKLHDGPRVLVTHYPLRTALGKVEPRAHRLRDHRAALAAAKACGVGLWLHGHIHKPFLRKPTADVPFPLVCGGSATQTKRWSHHEYVIDGRAVSVTRRTFDPHTGGFITTLVESLEMPG